MGRVVCRQSWASLRPSTGPGYQQVHWAASPAARRGFLGACVAQQLRNANAGTRPSASPETGNAQQVASAEAGAFRFVALVPGAYASGSTVNTDAEPHASGKP